MSLPNPSCTESQPLTQLKTNKLVYISGSLQRPSPTPEGPSFQVALVCLLACDTHQSEKAAALAVTHQSLPLPSWKSVFPDRIKALALILQRRKDVLLIRSVQVHRTLGINL